MYQGFVYAPSPAQKRANELATVRQLCAEQPGNAYWRNRLAALEGKRESQAVTQFIHALAVRSQQHATGAVEGIR